MLSINYLYFLERYYTVIMEHNSFNLKITPAYTIHKNEKI